jgi:hypothetical protein
VPVKTDLGKLLRLCRATVIVRWELADVDGEGARPRLVLRVRTKIRTGAAAGVAGLHRE